MVQPSSNRIAKYGAKFDPAAINLRMIAAEDLAVALYASKADGWATMESQVQVILNTEDIITNDRPKYYNFAREINKLVQAAVQDPALTTAVDDVIGPKYLAKGCASAALVSIALNVFSITFTPPAP
jgi:hypothetical protein